MRCRFERKIFLNEQNGYTVAVYTTLDVSVPLSARDKYLATKNTIGFTAVGFNLPLTDTIELEMEGAWENKDHGLQFQVENFLEVVPRTKEGIMGYLASGAIKGIGPKTAEAIYYKFGLQTLEVMENQPQELLSVRGISQKKLQDINESYGQNRVFRELMTFLAPYHVTPKKANLILQKFKDESVKVIRQHPYMLCTVKGFGFITVDQIGKQLCSELNDPMRISGCISYILQEAMKEGHLFLTQDILLGKVMDTLNKDLPIPAISEVDVNQVLYRLVMQNSIVIEGNCIYIAKQYSEESETASMIAKHLLISEITEDIEKELLLAQSSLGITLSEHQKQAVRMVFNNHLCIITGGPGTGKTTVLKVILFIHTMRYRTEVQLMAPTGRAARRMAESTGHQESSTMHMALGLLGDADSFELDFEYLEADLLNVDEVSMVDMHLAYEFFRRVKVDSRILLLGDVDQLPSVGAGDVFRQLIACGLIPVTVLDLVYRQGEQSNIPINAQLIQDNQTNLLRGEDFIYVPCKGPEEAAQIVKDIYLKEIGDYGID